MATAHLMILHKLSNDGISVTRVAVTSSPSLTTIGHDMVWSEVEWARSHGDSFGEAVHKMQEHAKKDVTLQRLLNLVASL